MSEDSSERSESRAELHVYEAHGTGLPPIRQYVKDLLQRWPFAAEFSRSSIRSANTDTVLGQLWLVLNPLLLAVVYYILINVLTKPSTDPMTGLSRICCGLFLFTMIQGAILTGATSVTGGGALISRMAFPRLLMPLAAVRTNLYRFFPTIPVYLVMRLFGKDPWSWVMLLSVGFLALSVLFSAGLAAVFAAMQVYFRDVGQFLPYVLRIWLYLSPVLWTPDKLSGKWFYDWMYLNPLFSIIGGWTQLFTEATVPGIMMWLVALAWSVVAFIGGSLIFMARERDFAVRI